MEHLLRGAIVGFIVAFVVLFLDRKLKKKPDILGTIRIVTQKDERPVMLLELEHDVEHLMGSKTANFEVKVEELETHE